VHTVVTMQISFSTAVHHGKSNTTTTNPAGYWTPLKMGHMN